MLPLLNPILLSMNLLFLNSLFHLHVTHSFSSMQPLCHSDESYALLQFKESFIISESASFESYAHPKFSSWKHQGENDDCCSWEGVACDKESGHVIGLDLGSSCLYGSFDPNSTLFHLSHLQKLILYDNDFNQSEIPSGFRHLTELKHLDLSESAFSGQIPSEISQLSNLVSLTISEYLTGNSLQLQESDFKSLVHNLTLLKQFDLSNVQINSPVPEILANRTSLTSLALQYCSLQGWFPTGIFHLPNLKSLNLYYNQNLKGELPEFHGSSPLQVMDLGDTSFYGEFPFSIGKLDSLEVFDIWGCDDFIGLIPSSFGNLTRLQYLELSYNNFSVQTLSSLPLFGKLTKLTHLGLDAINLHGEIPSSIASLTELESLSLHTNQLIGQIPSTLMKLVHLKDLDLSSNKLEGPIPSSVFELKNIGYLSLHTNNLSGPLELEMFATLKNLTTLLLSFNNLTVLSSNIISNSTSLQNLGLASCNLHEFPNILRNQANLKWLDLSHNQIDGQIPKWMWNSSVTTLEYMNLSYNSLTRFDQRLVVLKYNNLHTLDLRFNKLRGSLPILPASTRFYLASNNRIVGEISPLICSLNSLQVLDVSNNNLIGVLPQCLGNFSNSLLVLNLQNNSFHGQIPETITSECKLKMIDLSHNQLHGQVPRSLVNCKMLEFLDLANNHINDIFPSWLGTVSELRVLSLSSNDFHGVVGDPAIGFEFPNIHILDISHNNFTGKLPSRYFQSWKALRAIDADLAMYMAERIIPDTDLYFLRLYYGYYHYSLTIHNKGMERIYLKISKVLKGIDFSYNKFHGEIPTSIGNLKGLHLLDFSNNELSGHIPSSLGDLKELESLDLSCNKFSGYIPQELVHLNFLEFFNVSHNYLTGPIPQGEQFDTFQNNSYKGNSGLCGIPLSKKCGVSENSSATLSTFEKDQDLRSEDEFIWKILAAVGFGSGLVIGVVIECNKIFIKDWFLKTIRRRQPC